MIDFEEIFYPGGGSRAFLKSNELPTGMFYHIDVSPNVEGNRVSSKSCCGSGGSIRYYNHNSYDAAIAHGIAWAKRKIAGPMEANR